MDTMAEASAGGGGSCWGGCVAACYILGGEVVTLTAFGALGGFIFGETETV